MAFELSQDTLFALHPDGHTWWPRDEIPDEWETIDYEILPLSKLPESVREEIYSYYNPDEMLVNILCWSPNK